MKKNLLSICLFTALAFSAAHAADIDALKTNSTNIAKSGGAAAGLGDIAKAAVSEDVIKAKFGHLGDNILAAAISWSKDEELRESVPAFRRFLFFDYFTNGGNVIAAATNPKALLINTDAAVDNIFEDKALADAANKVVESNGQEVVYQEVGAYLLAAIPMKPSGKKAASCRACHASADVGKPYPADTAVLGWTLVAQLK